MKTFYYGIILAAIIIAAVGVAAWTLNAPPEGKVLLTISTTTSLYETGLLDVLDAEFEEQYPNINVTFISQGTGAAINTAKMGEADMILVHDAAREKAFLEDGYGVNRKIIAYNFFVIVGPEDDPAGVEGLGPVDALLAIKAAGSWRSKMGFQRRRLRYPLNGKETVDCCRRKCNRTQRNRLVL